MCWQKTPLQRYMTAVDSNGIGVVYDRKNQYIQHMYSYMSGMLGDVRE